MRNRWFVMVGVTCIAAMAMAAQAETPVLKGACCNAGGACIETEENDCLDSGGAWEGAGTLCSETDCVGACCFIATGNCTTTTQFACRTAGGSWQGAGVPCAGVCEGPSGACCIFDGSCMQVDASECQIFYSGDFNGYGTECKGMKCEPNKAPTRAACCLPTGACIVTDAKGCEDLAGIYDDGAKTCADAECIGACCYVTGTCTRVTQMVCRQGGGVWQGYGTRCLDGCGQDPIGACCNVISSAAGCGKCCDVTEDECGKVGGEWQGPGTTCDDDPCDACHCDLNLDGSVGFEDVLRVVADWGVCDAVLPCGSDVSLDGDVGFNDLLEVIAHWGPCGS